MHTVLFDGSFEGWLCAVFDVYEYKLADVQLYRHEANANIFNAVHRVHTDAGRAQRVWKGLQQRLSLPAQQQLYRTFLSECSDNELLHYVQYVFANKGNVENDYSHPAVLHVVQTARKVWREKHRMEAFVRFQKAGDGLYYACIEPDYDVLTLIQKHFTERYADQRWLIYDGRRRYGLYYDGQKIDTVTVSFNEGSANNAACWDEKEELYQQLWKRYFSSVNIAARKNTKLHLQHMPRRYWKHLTEKAV